MELLFVLLMCGMWFAPLFLAPYLMARKDRSIFGGFLLGLIFSWAGVIIAALWPANTGEPERQWQRVDQHQGARQRQLPEPEIIDDISFTPIYQEPEYVEAEIIEGETAEKLDRICAYCNEIVPKTAIYCSSCGKLLDVY